MKKNPLRRKEAIELVLNEKIYQDYFFANSTNISLFRTFKKNGLFKAANNPKPVRVKNGYQILEWNVLPYLEGISKKTRRLDGELIKIIEEASMYVDENGKHTDNDRTWWFFVKILINVPLEKVPLKIFTEAMPIWFLSVFDFTLTGSDMATKLLPTYLKQATKQQDDVPKVEELVNVLLSTKNPVKKKSTLGNAVEIKTKIDEYWLEEGFLKEDNSTLIAEKCSNNPIFVLANNIREIFNVMYEKQDYSHAWMPDLSIEPNRSSYNGEYFLAVILRKLALEKARINTQEGEEIIKSFLSDEYPHYLFKRLAILLIAEYLGSYEGYFELILRDTKENYFSTDSYSPELIYLLKKNSDKLSTEQRTKLMNVLKKGAVQDLPKTDIGRYQNIWKQRWCHALIKIPEFREYYNEIQKVTKINIVDERYEKGGWVNFDKSPLSAEDFLKKNNSDIVKYINEYKPKGDFPYSSPEGIQRAFQSSVKLNPDKFTHELTPFKHANPHTLSSLFDGLKEAWEDKKNLQWKEILEFITDLLQDKNTWIKGKRDKSSHIEYFNWALSSIGYLLQAGCKTDEWAFDENLHKQVEIIINLLVNNIFYGNESYQGDGVSHALNSVWGKVITVIIYLGLREARLSDRRKEKKESKWSKSLRKNFDKTLEKNIFEAYTLLGQYLPNLHYVDKKWTEDQIKKMSNVKDINLFEVFMEGYIFNETVYDAIYNLMRFSYKKALEIKFKESRTRGRLIQHIAIGYLRGLEEIGKNSLIDKIIKSNNSEHIKEFIDFFWRQRNSILVDANNNTEIKEQTVKFKQRIFVFWNFILDVYEKRRYTNEDKKVLSGLCKFAAFLPMIDKETFNHLLATAGYVTYDYDSPYFIEYLNQLKDKGNKKESAKYVGKLFIKMLEGAKDLIPDYDWKNIEEIVKYLYELKDEKIKDLANKICSIYAENGNLRLRSIYDENNSMVDSTILS